MALLSSSQFSNYLSPDGAVGPPANASQPVVLTLSDGSAVTIADAKTTCLALMETMRLRRQWMLQLSDDVFCIRIGATKLMFCENSLTLQRWVTSFHGVYLHGSTLFRTVTCRSRARCTTRYSNRGSSSGRPRASTATWTSGRCRPCCWTGIGPTAAWSIRLRFAIRPSA